MKYAIVAEKDRTLFQFRVFHETLEEAKTEAERLCRKEECKFMVLAVVAECEMQECPVVWRNFKEEK